MQNVHYHLESATRSISNYRLLVQWRGRDKTRLIWKFESIKFVLKHSNDFQDLGNLQKVGRLSCLRALCSNLMVLHMRPMD